MHHQLPEIISVDDHLIEPADLWVSQAPASIRDRVPHIERDGAVMSYKGGVFKSTRDKSGLPCDWWTGEDVEVPTTRVASAVSWRPEDRQMEPATFEEMLPGCYEKESRLKDMALAGVGSSICFPTLPRFAGTLFLSYNDKDLALWCVQAWNNWVIENWCSHEAYGKLIPLSILPLWDGHLAAQEALRVAEMGSVTVAFPENTANLDIPSIHTSYWEELWRVCAETKTVISTHIGSGGMYSTGLDSPPLVSSSLTHIKTAGALCDWLLSGIFERHPCLKVSLAEGQVGWMPYQLERLDKVWEHNRAWGEVSIPNPPSFYMKNHIYGCVFDDEHGLANRATIGMGQIMFETDYPHSDSTWPNCREAAKRVIETAGLNDQEAWRLLRGNAIECFGLDRLGLTR